MTFFERESLDRIKVAVFTNHPAVKGTRCWVYPSVCVSNRSHWAWGKTGGAGGMRLVPPLHPEGPEGLAKQGAGVAPSARHRSTMAGGSWSLVPPSPAPLHERPAGRQQEGWGGQEAVENGRNGSDTQHNRLLWSGEDTDRGRRWKHSSDTMQLTTSSNELTH